MTSSSLLTRMLVVTGSSVAIGAETLTTMVCVAARGPVPHVIVQLASPVWSSGTSRVPVGFLAPAHPSPATPPDATHGSAVPRQNMRIVVPRYPAESAGAKSKDGGTRFQRTRTLRI